MEMAVVIEQDGEGRGCERLESPARFLTQARETKITGVVTTTIGSVPSLIRSHDCVPMAFTADSLQEQGH